MSVLRLIVTIAIACAWTAPAWAQSAVQASVRQLVIPFENSSGEPGTYWLGEAAAVVLTDDLLALGMPAITRDDRLRAFDRLRVPAVATLSHATVIRVGQLLGAAEVVVGTFEAKGNLLVVRARAIRLDTGRMAPEIVESGAPDDLFPVFARVARRLAPASRVTAEQVEQGHPPVAAFEQYIKGLLVEAPAIKISLLTQAVRLHPDLHRARIALWGVHTDQGDHPLALAAVRDVPNGHRLARQAQFLAAVSMMHMGQYQQAHDAFNTLNTATPDPALLNNLGVVELRRPAGTTGTRPVPYFTDALKLDGADADLFFNLGYAYWLRRDGTQAIYWLREAVRRNPADDAAHYVLGVALQAAGSTAEATREKALARQLSSEYADWEAKQPGNSAPRGLERVKTDIDVAGELKLEDAIVKAEQRDVRELATFHLDRGRRLFQQERDEEAIAELRRVVYLSPYQSEAHLLLGRIYLRQGRTEEAINALKISVWSDSANAEAKALLDKVSMP